MVSRTHAITTIPQLTPTGLPHPSLFPFQKITVDTYPADLDIDASVVVQDGPLDKLEVSKVPRLDQPIDLAAALQYGR